ncbi:poly A polymerase C-terminal region-like protein [Amniculicola lignicola CBS 123094]|uniref:Poly A polymerase C-terminal region-like protein n=1 Tax=Amniculicola lignicola CBS 123094 TaxID=1392246 RepID=A0A6A5VW04_9PLEO|nr:poly A polymerase C-terminal region-like protein [Amniculicola lignicola CBS 123094]
MSLRPLCSPRAFHVPLGRDYDYTFYYARVWTSSALHHLRHNSPLRRMSSAASPADQPHQPRPKRRKIDISHPRSIQPYGTMASTSTSTSTPNPTTLELTEVETKLRQLLLDVAAFIDNASESETTDTAVAVPEQVAKEKVVLRFTGGWVRDKLLGVDSQDIDVAINKLTGEHFGLKMIKYLEQPGNLEKYGLAPKEEGPVKSGGKDRGRKVAPGLYKIEANPEKSKNLETATTNIMGLDIDLVNLRKETYNEISRNPEMEFGTPEEDAMRRDATVNAMFYNLNTMQIEDLTGQGFKDMAAKTIRTPLEPYQTFKDDPLRMLRLIRFASRLDYKIDPEAEHAMKNGEILESLRIKISRERVEIELTKMLKGPRPHMALSLIDRLGLYVTIFTDPTRDMMSEPELEYFPRAYNLINNLLEDRTADVPAIITETFTRNAEERYLAWICASLIPWADAPTIPHQKPTQRPYYAAQLVAREGIKLPNKVSDIITAALRDGEDIRKLVNQCHSQLRRGTRSGEDATSRDVLGMAIRRWGPTWRTQVLWSLIYEVVLGSVSRETILQSYTTFLTQLTEYSLLEAYNFKPLLTGTQLAKALSTKPGPWMKDALDVVMAWQLRNPEVTDPTEAIEAVKASRNSELPSRLAWHFLTLTIRPLFSQTKSNTPLTPAGRHATVPQQQKGGSYGGSSSEPWKDPKNGTAIELLRWTLSVLDAKGVEANWGLLVPPILKMVDDHDITWKATACELLTLLLQSTAPSLLSRTGLGHVFEDTLLPFFTYLPTLTPESESVILLDKAFPALMALVGVLYPPPSSPSPSSLPSPSSKQREKFLDKILRECILSPLSHAPPSSYPRLATTLLSHLPSLLSSMVIDSVKHLQSLIPFLSDILAEPLGVAHPPLLAQTAKCMQSVVLNAWPRVGMYRGEVMRGVGIGWVRYFEENLGRRQGFESVKSELKGVVEILEKVLGTDEEVKDVWEKEKGELVGADGRLGGLFEGEGREG